MIRFPKFFFHKSSISALGREEQRLDSILEELKLLELTISGILGEEHTLAKGEAQWMALLP